MLQQAPYKTLRVLLLGIGLLLACSSSVWAIDRVLHFTQADMLREDLAAFALVPNSVDEAALPKHHATQRCYIFSSWSRP